MQTLHHMAADISGLLRNYKRKKITFLQHDNGVAMTDREARAELARLQFIGHKLIPCADCEGFDPFGGGCPGHPITEALTTPSSEAIEAGKQ